MSVVQQYVLRLVLGSLTALLLCVTFASVTGSAEADVYVETAPSEDKRAAAVASDQAMISAEEVARELLKIQEQMGGSVVNKRAALGGWQDPNSPVTSREAPRWLSLSSHAAQEQRVRAETQRQASRVAELRETAWQLDTRAHHLEELDLYDQADLLRDVAKQMRESAREMKQLLDEPAPQSRPQ